MKKHISKPGYSALAVLFCAALSACATNKDMLSGQDIADRAEQDYERMFSERPSEGQTISVEEAIARAIKYNLDNRLKLMETVVAQQRLDLLDMKKLPRLAANAGYTVRSHRQASSSLNLGTGVPNFGASTSQDKGIMSADLQLSWDTLDFGIGYLNARQAGDEVLIAVERQRKTVQNIIRDVQYAYWRMLGAQGLLASLEPLLIEIRQGLNDSYAAQQAKLLPLEECLDYQRAMLDIQRQMHSLRRDINDSRIELTALMGLPPGFDYNISDSTTPKSIEPNNDLPAIDNLRMLALRNRPELIEEDYKKRIALLEVKKARLRMIPGIELFTGYNYNDNSFLLHDTWASSGYRLTWDLLNLVSGPRAIRHSKSSVELADIRRMATSMAVVTQVDVAVHRINQARADYNISLEISRVDNSLFEQYEKRARFDQQDHLSVVEAKARKLLSNMRLAVAYADWQNAISQLEISIGYQPGVLVDHTAELEDLTRQISDHLSAPSLAHADGFYSTTDVANDVEFADSYKNKSKNDKSLSEVR